MTQISNSIRQFLFRIALPLLLIVNMRRSALESGRYHFPFLILPPIRITENTTITITAEIHRGESTHVQLHLRLHRVIPMVQLRSQIFRQMKQKFAGCSGATDKNFCERWRKRCKQVCHSGIARGCLNNSQQLQHNKDNRQNGYDAKPALFCFIIHTRTLFL